MPTLSITEFQFCGVNERGGLNGACQQAGLTTTLAECEALLESSDVSTDAPFDALARLGLQLVQSEAGP